jgi:signal transduction histidine kinase
MKQRLAIRLVLSHLLVILVVLGVAGAVLLSQSRRYFINADRRALLVQANVAAKNCDVVCVSTGFGNFDVSNAVLPPAAVISQNRGNDNSNLYVNDSQLTQNARIQASLTSDLRVVAPSEKLLSSVAAAALKGRASSALVKGQLLAAAPIVNNNKIVAAIEIRSDLRNVEGVIGDLRRRILGALALSALMATVIGWLRARAIARPVRELTLAAQNIAEGRFDQQLPKPHGHDELADLTVAFGEMRDRVQNELDVRNAFVADASHELRTPLTAIRGAVEILQDGGAERPEVRDRFLASLDIETNRLLGLVDSLLQLQTGEIVKGAETVDLCALSKKVSDSLRPLANAKNITIKVDECGTMPVSGNEAKLQQVFVNLIDNAITYSPPSTTVTVRVSKPDDRSVVEIEDQGPGIPEEDRERVFDRFVRLDHSRNRVAQNQLNVPKGGSGLGLAIARTIVVAHGGTLTLHTPQSGVGTLARVTFGS